MSSPSVAIRALDLLASEWTKFRSVRSTYWSLLVAVVTPVAVSAVVAFAFTSGRNQGPGLLGNLTARQYSFSSGSWDATARQGTGPLAAA